jgi:hypothetical protein
MPILGVHTIMKPERKKKCLWFVLTHVGCLFTGERFHVHAIFATSGTNRDINLMKGFMPELDKWRPNRDYAIIRDKAKQHVSKASKTAMDVLGLPILESFPAQCWDINCIEHVWAQLMIQLRHHRARTPDGFMKVIQKGWAAISQATIDKLVAGVPQRLQIIKELKGAWISSYRC